MCTPVNDTAPLLPVERYINAAILAALERDDAEPAEVKPVDIDLIVEDYTGELRWYVTVDVQYNSEGHCALYGFDLDSTEPALWQD